MLKSYVSRKGKGKEIIPEISFCMSRTGPRMLLRYIIPVQGTGLSDMCENSSVPAYLLSKPHSGVKVGVVVGSVAPTTTST